MKLDGVEEVCTLLPCHVACAERSWISLAPWQIVLETEFDNFAALSLYESLGFIREKRLYRFYLNGKDAFRLVLTVPPSSSSETRGKLMPRNAAYRSILVAPYSDDEDEVSSRWREVEMTLSETHLCPLFPGFLVCFVSPAALACACSPFFLLFRFPSVLFIYLYPVPLSPCTSLLFLTCFPTQYTYTSLLVY